MSKQIRSIFVQSPINQRLKLVQQKVIAAAQLAGIDCLEDPVQADLIVAIGGDGALLQTLRSNDYAKQPFVGIHAGTLGYLQSVGSRQIEPFMAQIAKGQYQLESLSLLKYTDGGTTGRAFNEIVVERAGPRAANLAIAVNGTIFEKFIGDGVIVATPQGSSAYAVAAGGALISNDLMAMQLVPINAHATIAYRSLQSPLVVDSKAKITITNLDARHRPWRVLADGQAIDCSHHAALTITLSRQKIQLLRCPDYNYFATLAEKFIK